MEISRLVSPRGKLLKLSVSKPRRSSTCNLLHQRRNSSSASVTSSSQTKDAGNAQRMRAKLAEREFFQSVLRASATKRDAKNFLARFDAKQKKPALDIEPPSNARVNLGQLYRPTKAVANSPVFSFLPTDEQIATGDDTLNVAIVKISDPQALDSEILSGVGKTLAQLSTLGVRIIVVLDFQQLELSPANPGAIADIHGLSQAFTDALNEYNDRGARLVDQSFAVEEDSGEVSMPLQSILLSPLRKGAITVIPPLAHTASSRAQTVDANSIMLALTNSLSLSKTASDAPWPIEISLNRIILLDSSGGIPDVDNPSQTHIFVNLAQDFSAIEHGLQKSASKGAMQESHRKRHLENLTIISKCLSLLPPSASALIATPLEIALSATREPGEISSTGVSTRPTRNTLIHNILTDKPLVSSSLPLARLYGVRPTKSPISAATFFKTGMPVAIVPDPKHTVWNNPGAQGSPLRLEADPRIDLPKLVHLIEDSFGRKLNVANYLKRIERHVAGVIIVGDYEGGAILTWEQPLDRPNRPLVPYLDKFAVLRRCQGSGGVADIVFNAMVRQCFPDGVVWRSRRDNPVNKWYFERSNGTWKLPNSNWTMFWTGSEVELGEDNQPTADTIERWKDYVAVCSAIQPSWADTSKPPE
jgi:amino-acid N-acetyltransferase